MSRVTAKAKMASTSEHTYQKSDGSTSRQLRITMAPDYADPDGQQINKAWADATPALYVDMTVNGAVADLFATGKKVTITFEIEDDSTDDGVLKAGF